MKIKKAEFILFEIVLANGIIPIFILPIVVYSTIVALKLTQLYLYVFVLGYEAVQTKYEVRKTRYET